MAPASSAPVRHKVLAAMSGGVDSCVAAALLAEAGHEVTGVTLKLACYGTTPLSPRATRQAICEILRKGLSQWKSRVART